jgi:Tol biopolymer transport system component
MPGELLGLYDRLIGVTPASGMPGDSLHLTKVDLGRRATRRADNDRPWRRTRRRWAGALLTLAVLAAVLAILLPRLGATPTGGPPAGPPASASPNTTDGAAQPAGGLLYVRGDDVWVANRDGTGRRNLTADAASDGSPDWSPDGRRIVYASQPPGCESAGCPADLYAIGRDGKGRVRLTSTPQSEAAPDWSPDGTRIAYIRWDQDQPSIWVMAADGSGQRQLTDRAVGSPPDWSPDGVRVLFEAGDYRLYAINADGTGRRQISGIGPVRGARWSPDGTRIALTMQDAVWVINADGGGLRRLKHGWYPSWSPDGRQLVYLAVSFASVRTGELQIRLMDIDGRNQVVLIRKHSEDLPKLG